MIEVSPDKNPWRAKTCAWVVRGGRQGQFEDLFLRENRVGIYWGIESDLTKVDSWEELTRIVDEAMEHVTGPQRIGQFTGMVWHFAYAIRKGDLVVVPRRSSPTLMVGEVLTDYEFRSDAESEMKHSHQVRWVHEDLPRSLLDQDIQLRVNSRRTVQRINLDDAVDRIREALQRDRTGQDLPPAEPAAEGETESVLDTVDLETSARDEIAQLIAAHFKSHDFTGLVAAVLQAQGYQVHVSPPGPDHGVDIIAGTGHLGFDEPRMVVQVKSGDTPVDRPVVDQLVGTLHNFRATHGLFVSWGGFRRSVINETANQFFTIRLWGRDEFIRQLLGIYDKLDEDIKAEIPLKRIWVVSGDE